MKQIDSDDKLATSADIAGENLEQLRAIFPEAFSEGRLDMQILRQLVGDLVVDETTDAAMPDEKYGLNWKGKRRARQLALTPSLGTLRPCPDESVDWDTTKNLMIEGDNLEVLKLLQKSYSGRVKLIYIDPPYNTGKDFVYPDNFHDNIRNYLELTGQIDGEGRRLTSNSESSGRFHTDWLNMMYPRLKLARNLLREDGAIFVSIEDGEILRLRSVLDEIFGEENFLAQLVWKSRVSEDTRALTGVSTDHEYVVCYGRSAQTTFRGALKDLAKFSNPDGDSRGPWRSADLTGLATKDSRPNLHYDITNPQTGIVHPCPPLGWRYEKSRMQQKIDEGRVLFPPEPSGRPRHKLFLNEIASQYKNMSSVILGIGTSEGTKDTNSLLAPGVFDFPKPMSLLRVFIEQLLMPGETVLDFFAGSGTTAHAVMVQNAVDKGDRRYIVVQLPEPLDSDNRDQKTAADYCDKLGRPRTIAELTKERLRRAGQKVSDDLLAKWAEEDALGAREVDAPGLFESNEATPKSERGKPDLGFRVFKLDTSNIRVWNPDPSKLNDELLANVGHVLPDRNDDDLLYEMLLKLGLDLAAPIVERRIAGKNVKSIGNGALMACLEKEINASVVEELAKGIAAWHAEQAPAGETTVFFRDSAFADDVAKSNLTAILEQTFQGRKRDIRIRSI